MAAQLPLEHHITNSLDEHIALINRQLRRSLQDPELRQLAVKLVSGRFEYGQHPRSGRRIAYIEAWGEQFLVPQREACEPRDARCELERIWDFVVLNVRYVYDPDGIDFFATARATLEAGGGDCDDMTILIGALGQLIGFKAVARVISTSHAPDDWSHIYPMLGLDTKESPSHWVPMDVTVKGSVPGWQYEAIARVRDYPLG
jgi:hypothetical protein